MTTRPDKVKASTNEELTQLHRLLGDLERDIQRLTVLLGGPSHLNPDLFPLRQRVEAELRARGLPIPVEIPN